MSESLAKFRIVYMGTKYSLQPVLTPQEQINALADEGYEMKSNGINTDFIVMELKEKNGPLLETKKVSHGEAEEFTRDGEWELSPKNVFANHVILTKVKSDEL